MVKLPRRFLLALALLFLVVQMAAIVHWTSHSAAVTQHSTTSQAASDEGTSSGTASACGECLAYASFGAASPSAMVPELPATALNGAVPLATFSAPAKPLPGQPGARAPPAVS